MSLWETTKERVYVERGSPVQTARFYDDAMASTETPRDRRVSRRIGAIAESATLKVDAKAKSLKAEGRPVIGFGAGEPDFPTPDYIVEAAVEACRDPRNHRYTPAGGLPELRKAIAEKTLRDSGLRVEPSHVMFVPRMSKRKGANVSPAVLLWSQTGWPLGRRTARGSLKPRTPLSIPKQ